MTDGTWLDEAKKNSGFLIFLGILTVVFGVIAVASPLITGVAVAVFVGFLLLASGIARIVHALKSRQWGTGFWGTVIGLLGITAGLLMVSRPLIGLVTMTMLLAIYFLVDGISEIVAAFRIKPDQGWGWVLFNGVIAVLLGFMIWRQWPVSGAWAIGLLVGVHILLTGWSMIILGSGARHIAGAIQDDVVEVAGDVAEKATEKAEDTADRAQDFTEDVTDRSEDHVDDVVDKAKNAFGGEKD